jgi:hypothetical protein
MVSSDTERRRGSPEGYLHEFVRSGASEPCMHAEIGELTLENDFSFLESALNKAGC